MMIINMHMNLKRAIIPPLEQKAVGHIKRDREQSKVSIIAISFIMFRPRENYRILAN